MLLPVHEYPRFGNHCPPREYHGSGRLLPVEGYLGGCVVDSWHLCLLPCCCCLRHALDGDGRHFISRTGCADEEWRSVVSEPDCHYLRCPCSYPGPRQDETDGRLQSCLPCIVLLIRAITSGEKRRRSTTRAHQVVLTCAFFDSEGQIMVTPEAFLPTRKIVERYIGRVRDLLITAFHLTNGRHSKMTT